MSAVDDRREEEVAPTPAELAEEVAELGRLLAETWWRGVARGAEIGLAMPARAIASRLVDAARPAAAATPRIGSSSRSRTGLQGSLRDRGAELLRRSADVSYAQDHHPAYRRILDELAPDEARILRLLASEGPQPTVDVRVGIPPATRLVRSSLSMVGADAGCVHPERSHAYLDNLSRLGLAAGSSNSVSNPLRYQLLEAQPEVVEAMAESGRTARTARRSLALTTFGIDFCAECLPLGAS